MFTPYYKRYIRKVYLLLFLLSNSVFSYGQWKEITPSINIQWYNSASFIDEDYGFVVGRYFTGSKSAGVILKTQNGGREFTSLYFDSLPELRCIHFINENIGYAAGDDGVIIKTIDGGAKWRKCNSFFNSLIYEIRFLNADLGFVLSDKKIYRTGDGGLTWELHSNLPIDMKVFFRTDKEWVGAGCTFGQEIFPVSYSIFITSDQGKNWELKKHNGGMNCYQDLTFPDLVNGYAVGAMGVISLTSDSGKTWTEQNIDPKYSIETSKFINEDTGYIGGIIRDGTLNSFMLRTNDGGKSWTEENIAPASVSKLYFPTKDVGYAIASSKIFKIDMRQGTDVLSELSKSIRTFPNPIHDKLTVANESTATFSVSLYNNLGDRVIFQDKLIKSVEFDLKDLPSGIYHIKIDSQMESIVRKVIISHL